MDESKELKATAAIVKDVLEAHPETRDSDNKLYIRVCETVNFSAMHHSFCEVLANLSAYGLPELETVRKIRQKVQQEYPYLAPSKAIMEVEVK